MDPQYFTLHVSTTLDDICTVLSVVAEVAAKVARMCLFYDHIYCYWLISVLGLHQY